MNVKSVWRLLLLPCFAAGVLKASDVELQLHGGWQITGEMGVSGTDIVEMFPYWSEGSLRVPLKEVKQLSVEPAKLVEQKGAEITCVGGSRLWLEDLNVSTEGVTGTSSWGERISLEPGDIHQVYFSSENRIRKRVVPLGAQDPVGLGFGIQVQARVNLSQFDSGHVYEVTDWPPRFLMEIAVKETRENLRYQLLCSGPDPRKGGRFILRISPHRVSVTVIEPDQQNRLRSINLPYPLQPGQEIRSLRLMGDLDTGILKLQVGNGEILEWMMESEDLLVASEESFSFLHLQGVQGTGSLEVDHVRLHPWESDDFPAFSSAQPGVILKTGKLLDGNVESLSEESASILLTSSGERLQLPRESLYSWSASSRAKGNMEKAPYEISTPVAGERFHFTKASLEPVSGGNEFNVVGVMIEGSRIPIPRRVIRSMSMFPEKDPLEPFLPEENPSAYIGLLNRDLIGGKFEGLEGSDLMVSGEWALSPVLRVHGAAVRSLKTAESHGGTTGGFNVWTKSGCHFAGKLLSLTEEHLRLGTDWAGEMVLDRDRIQRLERRETVRTGPPLMEESYSGWSFYDGMFVRLNDQPDAVQQTSTGWRLLRQGVYLRGTEPVASDRVQLKMRLGDLQEIGSGMITLEFNGFSNDRGRARQVKVRISARQIRAEVFDGGQVAARWSGTIPLEGTTPFEVSVNVHDALDSLQVKVADILHWDLPIPSWTFSKEKMPHEVRISLSEGAEGITLQSLEVREAAETPLPRVRQDEGEPGLLVFKNGDRMTGALSAVENGQASLSTSQGLEVEMPMDRLAHVFLDDPDPQMLRRSVAHARFTLGQGEDRFLAEVLGANSEEFVVRRAGVKDEFRIPVSRISEVEFNPYFLN